MTLTDGQIDGLSMAYEPWFREAYYRFWTPVWLESIRISQTPWKGTPAKRAPKVIQRFCASLSELQSTVVSTEYLEVFGSVEAKRYVSYTSLIRSILEYGQLCDLMLLHWILW